MNPTDNLLTEIKERMVRVETKLDAITDIQSTSNVAKEVASKVLDSTNSAHIRLDKVDKIIFWTTTTIVGTVIVALIGLLISNGGV